MPFVVTQPFGEHVRGSQLKDEDGEAAIEAGHEAFLVRVAAEPETGAEPKPGEPAPAV